MLLAREDATDHGAWDSTERAKHAFTSLYQYFITKNKISTQ